MGTGILTIDLDAVASNWRALDALSAPGVETAATVKADAYGLGVAPVARALYAAGARRFFVAVAEEGAVLRDALGPEPAIHVYSGHMPGDAGILSHHALIPMLNSIEQITGHIEALPGHPFGVQLDSGMNRLGMEPDEWAAVTRLVMGQNPVLLMSHLACADEPDHPMNAQQLAAFHQMTDGLPVPRSLAATGGVLLGPDYHFDLTRPGIGLYGALPFEDAAPVVQLSIPVIQTRSLAPGETVGYANSWTADEPTRLATIAAGYADGITRHISNQGVLFHDDIPCPLVGRVSMDLITVDITHLDSDPETLQLFSVMQTVDDIAEIAGTIGYEVLTSLGSRYARRYVSGGA